MPKIGEFYAHELTHMVLARVLPGLGTPPDLDEALALWIGGGREMTWPQVKRELATELERDPSWTLDRLLENKPAHVIFRLSAAAALLELAHAKGGISTLKKALNSPRDSKGPDIAAGVANALHMSKRDVEAAWRQSLQQNH